VITAALPNLNGGKRFLRGTTPGTTGTLEADAMQGHRHIASNNGTHVHTISTDGAHTHTESIFAVRAHLVTVFLCCCADGGDTVDQLRLVRRLQL
jgi:hypothetical protein